MKTQESKAGPRRKINHRGGMPAYKPTDETRGQVEAMAAVGITQEEIAKALKIGETTLQKYYAVELATAAIKANAAVLRALYDLCVGKKNLKAIELWLTRRLPEQWGAPAQKIEHSGAIGSFDLSRLSDDDLRKYEALVRLMTGDRASAED